VRANFHALDINVRLLADTIEYAWQSGGYDCLLVFLARLDSAISRIISRAHSPASVLSSSSFSA
jgi:hypothetical protein